MIVEDEGLATLFEAYLAHDFAVASANQAKPSKTATAQAKVIKAATGAHATLAKAQLKAAPKARAAATRGVPFTLGRPKTFTDTITVQPVLTPDPGSHGTMYVDHVLELIQSAKKQLSVQLAYIHPSWASQDKDFQLLIDAVGAAIKRRVVVRIINGQYENTPQFLELMHEAGLSGRAAPAGEHPQQGDRRRLQVGPREQPELVGGGGAAESRRRTDHPSRRDRAVLRGELPAGFGASREARAASAVVLIRAAGAA